MPYRLLQWNIWYREEPDLIVKELNRFSADIICLQEVTRNFAIHNYLDIPQFLAGELNMYAQYQPAHHWHFPDRSNEEIGNLILSKYPLRSIQTVMLHTPSASMTDVYTQQGRVYIEVTIDMPDAALTVGTTHLSFTDQFKSMPHHEQEIEQLFSIIKTKQDHFILTGDFNMLPESKLIQTLDHMLVHSGPPYSEPTWATKPIEFNGQVKNTLAWRIDYVYSTSDVSISSSTCAPTEISDHLPLLIEFSVKQT